jgi:adenylate cyclase
MKYRTKLYLSLAGTALISSICGIGVLLFQFRDHVIEDEQTKVMTIAATIASLIDPELLKQINSRADENNPAYETLKEALIKVRDANRRPDIYIAYIYALKPNPSKPGQLIYVADSERDPRQEFLPGDPVDDTFTITFINHLRDYYSSGKFAVDPWGNWISGLAPVFDKDGTYIGTIGADISLQRYFVVFKSFLEYFLIAFIASLAFALAGGYLLARRISISLRSLLVCVREIGSGNLNFEASLETHDEFEMLAEEINMMTQGLRERERLKLNFARYVSQHVMEKIVKAENIAKLEGERRKITVLFSDIRQFTRLAEGLPPEQVVSLLNEYFEVMLDEIFKYQGTLDKFLGDGIMVEFGAPLDDAVQEKHAVSAAVGMQKALKKLVEKWKREGKPEVAMGIGIHTGQAIVGNIGSEKRIEYTAVGDTVNIAARLEQATKLLKKSILISEMTYAAVKDEFKATSLGPMILPGRKEAITIYAIEVDSS